MPRSKGSTDASQWRWIPSLYFAEGLPYVTVMTVSVIMFKRLGLGNADTALYTSWLYLPWVVKPLWSPLVDIFGTKRTWIIAMQLLMALAFGCVSLAVGGAGFLALSMAAFWAAAMFSATHDIAADGFYMLALDPGRQSFFVGIRSTFYRISTIVGQGALVMLAGWLEIHPPAIFGYLEPVRGAWMAAMGAICLFFLAAAFYHQIVMPRPAGDHAATRNGIRGAMRDFGEAFSSFFRKPGIMAALAFMLLYRFPEAQLIKLINPFMLDPREAGGLGMDTLQVGFVYGTLGIGGLTAGGITGGIVASRGGLRRWLWPMSWSLSVSCLAFLYLAWAQPQSQAVIGGCVLLEQIGYGFGFTAYTLYLLGFSRGRYATAHYAICTGFMALGMMIPGMLAGALQEWLGYRGFFWWVTACCAVTIAVTALVKVPRDEE